MPDALKPGGLGSAAVIGTPSEFAGSMAQAMETALNDLLSEEGRPQVPTDNSAETRDRRTMFLAIAQGVVNHLAAHPDAFEVLKQDDTPSNHHIVIHDE